jgi:hypothetical protein
MNAGIKERRRRREANCEETRIWLEAEDPERWRRIEANHIAAAPIIMSTWSRRADKLEETCNSRAASSLRLRYCDPRQCISVRYVVGYRAL